MTTTLPAKSDPHPDTDRKEELPPYTCTVLLEGIIAFKPETYNLTERQKRRSWTGARAEICGTTLKIYPHATWAFKAQKRVSVLLKGSYSTTLPGPCKKVWTLQAAEAGLAVDYTKWPFVIRVRMQDEQALLAMCTLGDCMRWLDALQRAIAVSAPIDDRQMTHPRSLPSTRRPASRTNPQLSLTLPRQIMTSEQWPYPHIDAMELHRHGRLLEILHGNITFDGENVDTLPMPTSSCSSVVCTGYTQQYFSTGRGAIPEDSSDLDDCLTAMNSGDVTHAEHVEGKFQTSFSSSKADELDYARRCADVLRYGQKRQRYYFVRDGCKVSFRDRDVDSEPQPPAYDDATSAG